MKNQQQHPDNDLIHQSLVSSVESSIANLEELTAALQKSKVSVETDSLIQAAENLSTVASELILPSTAKKEWQDEMQDLQFKLAEQVALLATQARSRR